MNFHFENLTLDRISYSCVGKTILRNISWNIRSGEIWIVLGPNGGGKTTLLRCLARQLRVTAGSIQWDQASIDGFGYMHWARCMSYLPQKLIFNMPYTVEQVLRLSSGYVLSDANKISEAVNRFSLSNILNQSVMTLSGGELQRLLLASVHVQSCPVVCLDEPFNCLDPAHIDRTVRWLEELHEQGRTLILVVHEWNWLSCSRLAEIARALLIKEGAVFFEGTYMQALDRLDSVFDRSFKKVRSGENVFVF